MSFMGNIVFYAGSLASAKILKDTLSVRLRDRAI